MLPLLAKKFSLIPLLLENARRQASCSRAFRRARIAVRLNHEDWASLVAQACNAGDPGSIPGLGRRDLPWRRKWQSTPALLPGKSHGRRSLIGYSPWGHKESDMTERLHFHFNHEEASLVACNAEGLGLIPGSGRSPGEGNGNPLQYSCLENPMYRGAWQATVHGVAKS